MDRAIFSPTNQHVMQFCIINALSCGIWYIWNWLLNGYKLNHFTQSGSNFVESDIPSWKRLI